MSQIMEDVADATLSKLVERWFAWRGDARYPARKSIEPIELGSALPFVWLCEKVPESQCYRYRLVGEAVNTLYGQGLRGRLLKDFLSQKTATALRVRLDQCLESGNLLHTIAPQTLHDKRHVLVQRLFLPITGENGAHDTILGCTKVTGAVLESDRYSATVHQAAYNCEGERVKVSNPVVTMFSSDLEF